MAATIAPKSSHGLVIRLKQQRRASEPRLRFVDADLSFQELFEDIYYGDIDVGVRCRVGFKKPGDMEPNDFVSVDLSETVGSIITALGANFVDMEVIGAETAPPAKVPKLNAFDVMMKAASTRSLPPELTTNGNGTQWQQLYNRILRHVEIMYPGAGFPAVEVQSGAAFFKKLTNIVWYLDPNIPKFLERSLKMPNLILGLYDDMDSLILDTAPQSFIGFNDWKAKKIAKPQLLYEELSEKVSEMYDMLQFAWLARTEWKTMKEDLEEIGKSMRKYLCMLEKKNEKIKANQMSLFVPRSPFTDATVSTVLSKGAMPVPECYKDLWTELQTRPLYDAIFLNDFIGDDSSKDVRYHYVSNLLKHGLSGTSFEVMKYSPGGSWRTCIFLWKVPDEGIDRQKSDRIAGLLKEQMPTFHTRAMQAEFRNRFSNVAKITPAIRRAIYRFLTDDNSVNDNAISKALDIRMELAINSEDPDLLVDLREMNEGRPGMYNVFWDAFSSYLEEHMAAQERRHGDVGYMPLAISVPDLITQVKEKLPDGTPIPSEAWVRFQFWPKDPSSRSATQYTGRFNVRFHVQTRQIRHTHPDVHYCAALAKYLRSFMVKFKCHSFLHMEDDKHFVNIGEPHCPLASVQRGRRVLVTGPESTRPTALDHDFCRFHVTPSVTLVPEIPNSPADTLYQGQVYVAVKDSVFQPSSALRHAAENSRLISSSGKAVVASIADGGPDHNVRHGQAQLAHISTFQKHDLDMSVAINTCPGNSWANPTERIMSLLNLALNGVSLSRVEMSKENKALIKSPSNMKEMRAAAEKNPDVKSVVRDSLQKPVSIINDRFRRLSLKGTQFQILPSVSDEQITGQFRMVHEIDESIKVDETQRANLLKRDKLQTWYKEHCRTRQYSFQVKKCTAAPPSERHREEIKNAVGTCESMSDHSKALLKQGIEQAPSIEGLLKLSDAIDERSFNVDIIREVMRMSTCKTCHPPRLPLLEFRKLTWLPDPQFTDASKQHYKPFDDIYGEDTVEVHRPGAANQENKTAKPYFTKEKVRDAVECVSCGKWRCVYSPTKPSRTTTNEFSQAVDSLMYSCGAPILPEEHPLASVFLVREAMSCNDPVERQYYSCNKFDLICCKCGITEPDSPLNEKMKNEFKVVNPVCRQCAEKGEKPIVSGPKSALSRGRKR